MTIWSWFSKKKPDASVEQTGNAASATSQPNPQLMDIVERKASTGYGGYADLDSDLAQLTMPELEKSPLVLMAYGYARRLASRGLLFQGLVDEAHTQQSQQVFVTLQGRTEQTIGFQEAAGAQAVELLMLYLPDASKTELDFIYKNALQGITARQILTIHGEEVTATEAGYFPVEFCIELAQRIACEEPVAVEGRELRLIDVIEKRSKNSYGPFADMFEDLKVPVPAMLRDPLISTATGYAMWLAASGVFVAGGVQPQILVDARKLLMVFSKDADGDPDIIRKAKAQAIALASTYVPEIDDEAAAEIMAAGDEIVSFYVNEERRLTPSEVVERAKERAESRSLRLHS